VFAYRRRLTVSRRARDLTERPTMYKTNKRHIDVLNDLIATTLDSAAGYQEAAEEAKSPHFRSLFEKRATQRRQIAADLKVEVRSLGGRPEDDGTILAAAHRMFLNLKSSLAGDDRSVVNEVERGEDHIKAKFGAALNDENLPAPVKATIARAYASIKADHDQMRDLKRQLEFHAVS
jgi:uncharacterized protein (TIGR02284 family)